MKRDSDSSMRTRRGKEVQVTSFLLYDVLSLFFRELRKICVWVTDGALVL